MTDITVKTSSANINKLIKAVKVSADKYNTLVQDAIVAIVIHANTFRDCTGAARLIEAMPRSNRRQLVVDHFSQYSPINVQRDKDGNFKASLRKPYFDKEETKPNKAYNDFNIDGVRANKWYERPEAERLPDVVDYASIRTKMLAFFESSLKKCDKIENENDRAEAKNFVVTVRSAASAFNAKAIARDALKGTEWDDDANEEEARKLSAVA